MGGKKSWFGRNLQIHPVQSVCCTKEINETEKLNSLPKGLLEIGRL